MLALQASVYDCVFVCAAHVAQRAVARLSVESLFVGPCRVRGCSSHATLFAHREGKLVLGAVDSAFDCVDVGTPARQQCELGGVGDLALNCSVSGLFNVSFEKHGRDDGEIEFDSKTVGPLEGEGGVPPYSLNRQFDCSE